MKQKLLDDACISHQKEPKSLLDQHHFLKRQDISNGKKVMETPITIFQGETSGSGNSNYMLKKSKTSTDLISSNISISGISSKDCKHNNERKSKKPFAKQFQKSSFVKKSSLEKPFDVVVANSKCISNSMHVLSSSIDSPVVSDKSSCTSAVDVKLKQSSFYLKQVPKHLRQSHWMSKQEVAVSKITKARPISNKKKETKRQVPQVVKKQKQLPHNKKIASNLKRIPKSKHKRNTNQVWRKVSHKANKEGPKQKWVPKTSVNVLQTESPSLKSTSIEIQEVDELEIFLHNTDFVLNNWDEFSKRKDSEEIDLTSSKFVQFVKD